MATYASKTYSGTTDVYEYAITFSYARGDDIFVYVDDVLDTDWYFSSSGASISWADGDEPQTGETFVIKRVTDISDKAVIFTNGSGFVGTDINTGLDQLLFAIDELQVPAFEYTTTMTLAVAGAIQVAHGLGAAPTRIELQLECLSTDAGWADGDFFPVYNYLGLVSFDATNMNINEQIAAAVGIRNQNTGSLAGAPTPAKWNLIVRAWR